MDATGGAKTIRLIANQDKMARREIPYSVVLTRISAAVRSRALKNVQDQLTSHGIDMCRLPRSSGFRWDIVGP